LWFAQLAMALKKTAREYIDLEIDVPRRFWLRTQPERLDSNHRIFRLLRTLPDSTRREWLGTILKQLDVAEDAESNETMLTWDQIRSMKSQGIEFGGHTVTHAFLSKMTREQVAREVSECKRRIEEELQTPVHHFAYPNGQDEDFSVSNMEMLRSAGYQSAVTTLCVLHYRSTY